MIYTAILIHPELSFGRSEGDLHIENQKVKIIVEDFEYEFPLSELIIETGGAGNKFVFLKSKYKKDISIYTKDKRILNNSILTNTKAFVNDIKEAKKGLNEVYWGISIVAGLFLLLATSLYLFKDNMVHSLANKLPVQWEEKLGDKLFIAIENDYAFLHNDSILNVITTTIEPIINEAKQEGFNLEFFVIEDDNVNAFALPGGKIVINSGLLTRAESWEEVAGVLSHEVAHVTLRHHVRGAISKLGIFTIVSFLIGDGSAVAATVTEMGSQLESLAYSRSFEIEADNKGWEYLKKANINPYGMITFFEKLEKENESSELESLMSFISTHPDTKERITSLKNKPEQKEEYTPLELNYKNFKEAILYEIN
ncbi:MAG: M48 family metallopeptidase [Bacteroidota bacterium]